MVQLRTPTRSRTTTPGPLRVGMHSAMFLPRLLHAPRRTVVVNGQTHEKGARMTGKHPSRRLTESRLIDRTSNNFRPLVAASLCALFAIGCGDDPGPTDPPDPPDPPGPPAGFQIEIRYV